jgi:hypothetical protein
VGGVSDAEVGWQFNTLRQVTRHRRQSRLPQNATYFKLYNYSCGLPPSSRSSEWLTSDWLDSRRGRLIVQNFARPADFRRKSRAAIALRSFWGQL